MPHVEILRAELGGMLVPDGTVLARLEQGPGDGEVIELPAKRGYSPATIVVRIDDTVTHYFKADLAGHRRRDEPRRYCWTDWDPLKQPRGA